MSSILTNNGALVALQTLKNINSNLTKTQGEISTGKSIANAKDNAAIWAISRVMESDVSSIKTISTALNTANATVSTAREASEEIGKYLEQIKSKIVTSQTASASDRAKLQADIDSYKGQIEGILGTAQFNGVNLIDGSSTADYSVLASLDRSGGSVTTSKIDVSRQNLALTVGSTATPGATAVTDLSIINNGGTNAGTAATLATAGTQNIQIASVGSGYTFGIALDDSAGANLIGAPAAFTYTATAGDSSDSVASKLALAVQDYLASNGITAYHVNVAGTQVSLVNNSGDDLSVTATSHTGGTPASGGGLAALNNIDVTSDAGAASALVNIESMINTALNAAAALGSSQTRIENQNSFIGKLADQMTSGIGSLVDADMEEASARLQALQTQQQLGIQALSIANQAPSAILTLFR